MVLFFLLLFSIFHQPPKDSIYLYNYGLLGPRPYFIKLVINDMLQ